ncbi:MAG TPA: GNAT family N-acetyltransferase [Anaerolineales bacterium]|nr:GNAT family N-acetyltransferase [Anaerolineales bacterium]
MKAGMEIHIRKATANDYDDLCELFDEVDALHRVNLPHVFQKSTGPAREKDYYLGLIADENIGLFVAEMKEKLAGFVHVLVRDTPVFSIVIPRRYAIVDGIAVKSEFQKHGIGKMLMDKAQEWAETKDAEFMELNVYEFNRNAISFYEGLGYQSSSRKMRKEISKAG